MLKFQFGLESRGGNLARGWASRETGLVLLQLGYGQGDPTARTPATRLPSFPCPGPPFMMLLLYFSVDRGVWRCLANTVPHLEKLEATDAQHLGSARM